MKRYGHEKQRMPLRFDGPARHEKRRRLRPAAHAGGRGSNADRLRLTPRVVEEGPARIGSGSFSGWWEIV